MAPVTKASIAEGRAAYSGGLYKLALEHFTLVANGCSCNSGPNGRRGRCTCKNFAAAARRIGDGENNPVFHEAMHVCSCGVAEKFQKCHEPQHIQALDYRIHVFEKMARRENAQKDAEWLLEIAPRALEGYLRLGKAYRLAKMPDEAYGIWTAGIKVAGKEGHGGSPKLHQLYQARQSLQIRFARKDPLQELPVELAEKVFSSLSIVALVQCLGVSKRWRTYLKRNSRIWSDMHFYTKRMPSTTWFQQLRQTTGGEVQSLQVTEPFDSTGMDQRRWRALIGATQRVRHLTLSVNHLEGLGKAYMDTSETYKWSQLRSLRLRHSSSRGRSEENQDPFPQILHALLQLNVLEELKICTNARHISRLLQNPQILASNRLRRLALEAGDRNTALTYEKMELEPEELMALARNTPLLEQLWLPWLTVNDSIVDSPLSDVRGLWPHLQVLRLQNYDRSLIHPRGELAVPLASLRSFDLHCKTSIRAGDHILSDYCRYIQDNQDDETEALQYPTLERYWCPTFPVLSEMKPCLAQSLNRGALSVFGTQVQGADSRYEDDKRVELFLQDLQWMAGEPSIKTLGLFNIDLHYDRLTDWRIASTRLKALLLFIQSFPNLETIAFSIISDADENAALLGQLLAMEKIKTIVSGPCTGAKMDILRRRAEENKVALSFGRGNLWHDWPLDLNQLDKFPFSSADRREFVLTPEKK